MDTLSIVVSVIGTLCVIAIFTICIIYFVRSTKQPRTAFRKQGPAPQARQAPKEHSSIPMLLIAALDDDDVGWTERAEHSLDAIGASAAEYACVVVSRDSKWNDWSQKDPSRRRVEIVSSDEDVSTKRNLYMESFEFSASELFVVVDLKYLSIDETTFHAELEKAYTVPGWDALASNRSDRYYDVWSLRSRALGCTFNCWERVANDPEGTEEEREQRYVRRFQVNIPKESPWIPCESAFGSLVVYKTNAVKDRRYKQSEEQSEHVVFNEGLKMFIDPALISG